MSILIVDDNRVSAKLLEMQLAAMGYQTQTVASGTEVLDVLRTRSDVELLITDLLMPGMDGVDLIRSIRNDSTWCRLPIIVVTGVADVQSAKRVASLWVQHYLVKPAARAQLESAVRAALTQRDAGLVSPNEVMQRLSVDEAGYQALAEAFLAIVAEALARLQQDASTDGLPRDLPLRELEEAAGLLSIEPLQTLAGRLANPRGDGPASGADDRERLSILLRMVMSSVGEPAGARAPG